jgi:hypothetical protein
MVLLPNDGAFHDFQLADAKRIHLKFAELGLLDTDTAHSGAAYRESTNGDRAEGHSANCESTQGEGPKS